MKKPIIYVASPYTKGDPGANVHFQMKTFNELMNDGLVWPVVPLWTHFQHIAFPRHYKDWIEYDKALLPLYDGCLRLNVKLTFAGDSSNITYFVDQSSGADGEVKAFQLMPKPVFFSIPDLYEWVRAG